MNDTISKVHNSKLNGEAMPGGKAYSGFMDIVNANASDKPKSNLIMLGLDFFTYGMMCGIAYARTKKHK